MTTATATATETPPPCSTGPKLKGPKHEAARAILRAILEENVGTLQDAATEFHRRTGRTITLWCVRDWAARWGINRKRRPLLSREDQAFLRRLLGRGLGARRAAAVMQAERGVTMSPQGVSYYCLRWDITPHDAGPDAGPCDLCGDAAPGERHHGQPWKIEGSVCDQCRDELMAETIERKRQVALERRHAARAAKLSRLRDEAERLARKRKDEHDGRALRCRIDAGMKTPGSVLNPTFDTGELHGPALTHWLKALWASGRASYVLTRDEGDPFHEEDDRRGRPVG